MTKQQWESGCMISGISVPAKCALFQIELWFITWYDEQGNPSDNRLEKWHIHNQCWLEIRAFRETLFSHGFFLERTPGRGEIIFPLDLRKMLIDINPKGFKENV